MNLLPLSVSLGQCRGTQENAIVQEELKYFSEH